MLTVNHSQKTWKTKYFYLNNYWPIFKIADIVCETWQHVFKLLEIPALHWLIWTFLKKCIFIVALTGESSSENLFKKAYLLPRKVWKNPIFCLQLYDARQERINIFFKCDCFCGGLRRFLSGFQLYASNYTPHPAVILKIIKKGIGRI